jgi:hypothetical protein
MSRLGIKEAKYHPISTQAETGGLLGVDIHVFFAV